MLTSLNNRIYHAALYIRLSREDDGDGPSESISNQKTLLLEFARSHHIDIYDIYVDDGWSGGNFNRPDYKRMISDIEAKHVNMVITKDLSRLGRDYIGVGYYMEHYFPEHDIRYISLLDNIDTGIDSASNEITPFRAILNDMYARDISKKITAVKRSKQAQGLFIGGKPMFGYKMHPTEKNQIVIDEPAAAIVRYMFGLAYDGMSCRQIAVRLNELGVPTPATYANLPVKNAGPYTGLWSSERVSQMLQNEIYIGNMVQGRTQKISYKSPKCRSVPRNEWIVVEGTHEPIIPLEIFHAVQRLIHSRRHTRSRTYDTLLKGLIYCHECKHPLGIVNRKNAAGDDVLYFICRTYQRFTKAGVCTSHTIKAQTVTEALQEKLRSILSYHLDTHILHDIALAAIEKAQEASRSSSPYEELHHRLDRLTNNLDRVYIDHLNGILTDADFQRIFTRLKLERDTLATRLSKSALADTNVDASVRADTLVRNFIDQAITSRDLLSRLIDHVELTEARKVIIKFRFHAPEGGYLECHSNATSTPGSALHPRLTKSN